MSLWIPLDNSQGEHLDICNMFMEIYGNDFNSKSKKYHIMTST